jgi:hypothetical protein
MAIILAQNASLFNRAALAVKVLEAKVRAEKTSGILFA